MRKIFLGLIIGAAVLWSEAALADGLKLSGKNNWLVVASTKDIDVAIGIARGMYSNAQVVTSQSGFYAVIMGPYAANSIAAVKKLDSNIYELPKDALLTDGAHYLESVWTSPSQSSTMSTYEIDKPLQLSTGDISVTLKLDKVGDDQFSTVVSGEEKNGPKFTFTVGKDGEYVPSSAQAAFIRLDASSKVPQLVFTRFSGGAHCCTMTWIAMKPDGAAGWSLIEAANLDGGGYWFEDVDGDGGQELLSVDNNFLYAFDSYAGSVAPVHVSKLRNGVIEDVSEEPAMQTRLKQDLAGLEYNAKVDPGLWKSNGFLAGWVANKMRLGQGVDAWQVAAENLASDTGFGPQQCSSGQKIDDCPAENLKQIPVLEALADFLKENGYGPLPDAAEKLLH